ncbi:unnamed protein product, partial [Pleuronectes platessa]
CLLQAFVMYSFACCELSNLAVMAYDRYLAICRPLHYHTVMSKRRLSQLAFVMYSFACCELSNLAVMAYDRYLAICRPLHYHSVMSKRRLSQLAPQAFTFPKRPLCPHLLHKHLWVRGVCVHTSPGKSLCVAK